MSPSTLKYAFCESVWASGRSPWHLRPLTDKGLKLGGGIDTSSLCGRVRSPNGWDVEVSMTEQHLAHACPECVRLYRRIP